VSIGNQDREVPIELISLHWQVASSDHRPKVN